MRWNYLSDPKLRWLYCWSLGMDKWWHRFESTLAQVMACCLMAPGTHCLNLSWIIISGVYSIKSLWPSDAVTRQGTESTLAQLMEVSWVRSPHTADHFQANVTSTCPLKASVDCRLPASDSIEIYLSWDQIPIYIGSVTMLMASCLKAPSHYLNQCSLIISKVLWHSSEVIIMRRSEDTNQ